MSLLLCTSSLCLELHDLCLDVSGSRESERFRWVHFGGLARLVNFHVSLFMSVVDTSQCLHVVYIVVSNYFLFQTTDVLNGGITILQCSVYISFYKL
jgi:hypothetical protein